MDLKQIFSPAAIAAHYTEANSNTIPYLGSTLFPATKKAGLDLKWIKGHKGLPISLMPSAFDAKATYRDRIGVSKVETEMPFFREGMKIKERDRQEILRVQDSNDPYAAEVLNRIFNDYDELLAGAMVVPERMIMQLLFPVGGSMGITIKANGANYTYNYDPNGTWASSNYTALSGNRLWSATTTADPFADFKAVKDAIRIATGSELTVAIMNTTTFNLLGKIDAVKNRYLSTSGISFGYLTDDQIKSVIAATSGVQIVVYDKMYKDESGTAHSFVPDNYVALIPAGSLGSTAYGTTPEEADGVGDVSIVNTGVAISRIVEEHPVNINTIASEIVLPSFERMDEVACLKVV